MGDEQVVAKAIACLSSIAAVDHALRGELDGERDSAVVDALLERRFELMMNERIALPARTSDAAQELTEPPAL